MGSVQVVHFWEMVHYFSNYWSISRSENPKNSWWIAHAPSNGGSVVACVLAPSLKKKKKKKKKRGKAFLFLIHSQ